MRSRTAVALAAAAMAVALTGCGADSPNKPGQTAVEEAGCENPTHTGTDELYALDAWTCASGDVARVYTFATNAARDSYVEVAEQFGGTYTTGDKWAAAAR